MKARDRHPLLRSKEMREDNDAGVDPIFFWGLVGVVAFTALTLLAPLWWNYAKYVLEYFL